VYRPVSSHVGIQPDLPETRMPARHPCRHALSLTGPHGSCKSCSCPRRFRVDLPFRLALSDE
jgi:hypothetical protein